LEVDRCQTPVLGREQNTELLGHLADWDRIFLASHFQHGLSRRRLDEGVVHARLDRQSNISNVQMAFVGMLFVLLSILKDICDISYILETNLESEYGEGKSARSTQIRAKKKKKKSRFLLYSW
jgi:hypothetical protein